MDSNEVLRAACALKISNFLGVFAADQIKSIKSNQVGTLIVNTDPSYLDGKHWISFCLDKKDIYLYDPLCLNIFPSEYFNHFVLRMNKALHLNMLKVQATDSVLCGYHALVFCYVMNNHASENKFRSFLNSFHPYNVSGREQLSLTYYTIVRENESKSNVKS